MRTGSVGDRSLGSLVGLVPIFAFRNHYLEHVHGDMLIMHRVRIPEAPGHWVVGFQISTCPMPDGAQEGLERVSPS
jgi:hypothetical protein